MTPSKVGRGVFVTGTDTDSGKTWVSLGLIEWLKGWGNTTLAMKPVASGCTLVDGRLKNSDALLLQKQASFEIDYEMVNPYALEPAIAPHIASSQAGCDISLNVIEENYQRLQGKADAVVVEGVGGWEVPLSEECAVAELGRRLGGAVILVVGLRLGCLNHAILTCQALERSGCRLLGWVANHVDPEFAFMEENLETLKRRMSMPLLGVVPALEKLDAKKIAQAFDDPRYSAPLAQYFEKHCFG